MPQITKTREDGYWWPKINQCPLHGDKDEGTVRLFPELMKAQMPCADHSLGQLCKKFLSHSVSNVWEMVLLYRAE